MEKEAMKNCTLPITITLLVVNVLVIFSIRPYGYELSSMIRISRVEQEGTVAGYFQKGMVIFDAEGGYDGQYYYYTAMDPFMREGLFNNAYRRQRILYPLLSRAAAFGDVRLLPYSMYAVNLVALAFGVFFLVALLRHYGASPWWSLFYGLSPAAVMTVQYDLPNPVSAALIIAALYSYVRRSRVAATSALLAVALLTREDAVMALVPLMLWDYVSTRSIRRVLLLAASLVPFFLWQWAVVLKTGAMPTASSAGVVSVVPLYGILAYFSSVRPEGLVATLKVFNTLLVLVYFLAVSWAVIKGLREKANLFYCMTAAYCLLVFFTVPSQWNNFNGLLRMFYGIFPLVILSYAAGRSRAMRNCVLFIGVFFLITVVKTLFVTPVFPYAIW